MTTVIKGLHYGKPTKTKGFMYLMLRKFHWKIDRNTNPRMVNKGWIKPGNVVRVKDTVKGRRQTNSIYAIKSYSDERADELVDLLDTKEHPMLSVVSARNPHNHNRALINSTLRKMYNFYINHLQEAKELSATQVICAKNQNGKLEYRFAKK